MILKPNSFRMRTTAEFDGMLEELSNLMKLPRSRVVETLVQNKLEELKKEALSK